MEVIDFNKQNSILNQFIAEIRDVNIQKDQLRFRRNLERIGEIMALEVSKKLNYVTKDVQTPLGVSTINVPEEDIVLGTVFRAGLPLHQGFHNYFDHCENAFVSAYRKYLDEVNFDVHIEYMASPKLDGKTLILVDPMLATGNSMYLAYRALLLTRRISPPCGAPLWIPNSTATPTSYPDWVMPATSASAKNSTIGVRPLWYHFYSTV